MSPALKEETIKPSERGISLIEVLVVVGIVAALSVVAVVAMHTAVWAARSTNGKAADAVHAVANDARAAVAYDGTNAKFQNATLTENGVTIVVTVRQSTLTIADKSGLFQETIPLAQEAVDPYAGYIKAH